MSGAEIKRKIAGAGLRQWQIAEELCTTEFTLCRLLRHEVKPDLEKRILEAIDRLKGGADHER